MHLLEWVLATAANIKKCQPAMEIEIATWKSYECVIHGVCFSMLSLGDRIYYWDAATDWNTD